MEAMEKRELIDRFEGGARALEDTRSYPKELLTFRPFPDAWSIHEHVVHVLESDMAGFHRYRRAIAEPGTPVLGYDELVWTPALNYHSHDLGATLDLFAAERRYVAAHLRGIVETDWSVYSYRHSQFGQVGLEQWLSDYVDHVRIHRDYIDRNLRLWVSKGGPSLC